MTLEEAYKVLGIVNENVSSDDLREFYEVKLSQVHGFNRNKQIQEIKLAHQMIRNYRCSQDWSGCSNSYMQSTSIQNLPKKQKKDWLQSIGSMIRFVLMLFGVLFILLILFSIFPS